MSWAFLLYMGLQWSFMATSGAAEFGYFSGVIDYWHEDTRSTALPEPTPAPSDAVSTRKEHFAWHKYLDPKNPEFFREGDYTPPDPFMEIVRNPSDENLKNWFAYIGKKNELARNLEIRIQEFAAKKVGITAERKAELGAKVREVARVDPGAKRYRFRLYFDSHCPHCRKMLETLSDLQRRGFFVEARQLDAATVRDLPFHVDRAQGHEVTERNIKSVPLLLVGDLTKKVIFRIEGYKTAAEVTQALQFGSE